MTAVVKHELIEHALFVQALQRIEAVVARGLAGESLILPIFGPTRVGKTELIKTVMVDHPDSVVDGIKRMPVIRVVTPVNPTRRSLPVALLEALGSRRYGRSSAEELTRMACELLKVTGTRVLIFDEMQHFAERGSVTAAREAADWLKVLAEEMNLTLILTGLPIAKEVLTRNEQLRDRAEAVHEFRPYNWNHAEEQLEFRKALVSLMEVFIDAGWEVPDASDIAFSQRVYGSCLGRVGMLFKLFNAAEQLAKSKRITEKTLFKAHAETVGTGFLQFNPFEQGNPPAESLLGQGFVRMLEEAHMAPPSGVRSRSARP